jgi:hypothetical protein
MKVTLEKEQVIELEAAVDTRITELEKIRKKLLANRLPAGAVDERLLILRGQDEDLGLKGLLSEQLVMFENELDV